MRGLAIPLCIAACVSLAGCDEEPPGAAPPAHPVDPQLEAARVLLRYEKSRIDGILPPASWPEASSVRRMDERTFVVDIDTSQLPGGYPEQLIVKVWAAAGRTGLEHR